MKHPKSLWHPAEKKCIQVLSFLLGVLGLKLSRNAENTVIQLLRFCLIGIMNTSVYLAVSYFVFWIDESLYIVGSGLGFIVSIFCAYYFNQRFVFNKGDRSHVAAFFRTFLAYGATFLFSLVAPYVFVEKLGIAASIQPLLTPLVTIPVNFFATKLWAFRGRSESSRESGENT